MTDNLEFNIFDKNKESYIIGDLLNMPYFFANWGKSPHHNEYMYKLFKKTALQYPNNILGIYDKLRTDQNEPIPNVKKIINSIDKYIEYNLVSDTNLKKLLEMCQDKNVLCLHLRCGDKGVVDNEFINKIHEISSSYSKIIILTGIHHNAERSHCFPSVEESINNTKNSLKKILFDESKFIIDLSEPDIHLCIMRCAKNLMVHIGGFSMLGALAFNGDNLYLTKLFYPIAHGNTEFFNHIEKYIFL
jgi:hypothetical protein